MQFLKYHRVTWWIISCFDLISFNEGQQQTEKRHTHVLKLASCNVCCRFPSTVNCIGWVNRYKEYE